MRLQFLGFAFDVFMEDVDRVRAIIKPTSMFYKLLDRAIGFVKSTTVVECTFDLRSEI